MADAPRPLLSAVTKASCVLEVEDTMMQKSFKYSIGLDICQRGKSEWRKQTVELGELLQANTDNGTRL